MKQLGLGLNLATKNTRKRELPEEMERVVPWIALVQVVEPYHPRAKTGRPPFGIETMLRVVDDTLIAAPGSTKHADGERDPEMKLCSIQPLGTDEGADALDDLDGGGVNSCGHASAGQELLRLESHLLPDRRCDDLLQDRRGAGRRSGLAPARPHRSTTSTTAVFLSRSQVPALARPGGRSQLLGLRCACDPAPRRCLSPPAGSGRLGR